MSDDVAGYLVAQSTWYLKSTITKSFKDWPGKVQKGDVLFREKGEFCSRPRAVPGEEESWEWSPYRRRRLSDISRQGYWGQSVTGKAMGKEAE